MHYEPRKARFTAFNGISNSKLAVLRRSGLWKVTNTFKTSKHLQRVGSNRVLATKRFRLWSQIKETVKMLCFELLEKSRIMEDVYLMRMKIHANLNTGG